MLMAEEKAFLFIRAFAIFCDILESGFSRWSDGEKFQRLINLWTSGFGTCLV